MAVQVRPTAFSASPSLAEGASLYRLLHLLPKNLLSHATGSLVRRRLPFGLHTRVKNGFIRHFRVDCSEAEKPVEAYPTLGDFFVRKLRAGARPIAPVPLVCPVDGTLTMAGNFPPGTQDPGQARLTQIKGLDYSLQELTGPGWNLSDYMRGGGYLTLYLAPYDYHRIHAPITGAVTQVAYLPGALWPVNTWSVKHIPGLFVANERMVVELSGAAGKALVVMVGATNVGRITLDFHSALFGNRLRRPSATLWKPPSPLVLEKGQGLGCFELGSTVILILSAALMEKTDGRLLAGLPRKVRMGQGLIA